MHCAAVIFREKNKYVSEIIIRSDSLEIHSVIAVGATAHAHYRHPFPLSDSKLLVDIPL